ncbi:MAG: hypothetical protein Q8P49_00695 [Candidatus Liptonbacteria bacterium]|nr:hypothetical protein [Candidatus Liptonbacteria bacterium]
MMEEVCRVLKEKPMEALRGVLHFWFETGTEGGHWAFQDARFISPDGIQWSHEGLRVLEDGDSLKIFSPGDPTKVVWSGTIELRAYPVFTEDVFGYWIHTDQAGIDRNTWADWFFNEYPAELTPHANV